MNIKDPEADPIFREQAEIYSVLGGEIPVRIFNSIEEGTSLNQLMEDLVDQDFRGMNQKGQPQAGVTHQLLSTFDDMADKKLVHRTANGWDLPNYGQDWQAQMEKAVDTMEQLVEEGLVSGGEPLEHGGPALLFEKEEDIGDIYEVLGYPLSSDEYDNPEAIPALYFAVEEEGEVPTGYESAVERLYQVGLVEPYRAAINEFIYAPATEVGEQIYEDIVLEDREMLREQFGL